METEAAVVLIVGRLLLICPLLTTFLTIFTGRFNGVIASAELFVRGVTAEVEAVVNGGSLIMETEFSGPPITDAICSEGEDLLVAVASVIEV